MSSWDAIMLLSFCCSQIKMISSSFLPSNVGSCGIWESMKKGQWKDLTLNNMCFFNLCFLSENKSQFLKSQISFLYFFSENRGFRIHSQAKTSIAYVHCIANTYPNLFLTWMKVNRNWYDHIEHTYNVSGWRFKNCSQRKGAPSFATCVSKSFNELRMQQHQYDKMPRQ